MPSGKAVPFPPSPRLCPSCSPVPSPPCHPHPCLVLSCLPRWDANGDCTVQPSELSLIDHLLLSPGLRPHVSNVSIDNSAYRQYCGTNESDHWPIVVDIDLSTYVALTPLPASESVGQAAITAAAPPF